MHFYPNCIFGKIGLQSALNFILSVMISQHCPNRVYSQYIGIQEISGFLERYLKFEVVTFYNLSTYRYILHDKQNGIITG